MCDILSVLAHIHMKIMKLYVGCSLTQAPEDFKAKVEALKDQLRQRYEILDFIGLVAGTATDVYRHDIQVCVAQCDVLVGICDFPAIGLGYELGVAVEKLGKPTLALAHKDAKISRMLLGIDHPKYRFVRYESVEQIPSLIEHFIKEVGA